MARVRSPRLVRRVLPGAAAVLVLALLGWVWVGSLLPGTIAVDEMGYVDLGGGPGSHAGHGDDSAAVSVAALTADPDRAADLVVTLVARKETFRLASGRRFDGYTLNGSSPGPAIDAVRGQLVEVHLVNESVPDGVTLHWHGVDVPNGSDGVAGVTQDAVPMGGEYRYRFLADQVGTFWYHSHQLSHRQVVRGLFGSLVIREAEPREKDVDVDVTAIVHHYGGTPTVNGAEGVVHQDVPAGATARVRVVNTDNGEIRAWVSGTSFRVVAVDGTDLVGPTAVEDRWIGVTAGGRVDLEVVTPADGSGARVELGSSLALALGPPGATPASERRPAEPLDLLRYGSAAGLGAVAGPPDRQFDYAIGSRFALLDGRSGRWWTVNGHLFPDVPMYVVREGDVVRMRISNTSGDAHPMHLHGHHAVVLSRNGEPATGSPWWVDSLHVADHETYEIAFIADNPGIWMDHCHNLPHAAEGLLAHLMYEGVTTPFTLGGPAENEPE